MSNLQSVKWEEADMSFLGEGYDRDMHTFIWPSPNLTIHLHPRTDSPGWSVTCEELDMAGVNLHDGVIDLNLVKMHALMTVADNLLTTAKSLLSAITIEGRDGEW